ncbi:RdgB/HAM1 family non-canonical purine NTP pyrophosphatase [Saprospiraceae bacterium]|nr:RdgB/HAM1 family non-canonical purine NTP pyrophosphatase [Saprospiraceae bacterium]
MTKKSLVFATGNVHKLDEVNQKLGNTDYLAVAMKDLGVTEDIPETGKSMQENALQKATYLKEKLGIDCFAEDSGLEIKALKMAPGIYTARYAGPHRDNNDNMDKVLSELHGIEDRSAQFRAVIALTINGESHFFEGIVKGKIAQEKMGAGGFGYDPIFIPEGFEESFAILPETVKQDISHRSIAVDKMITYLESI